MQKQNRSVRRTDVLPAELLSLVAANGGHCSKDVLLRYHHQLQLIDEVRWMVRGGMSVAALVSAADAYRSNLATETLVHGGEPHIWNRSRFAEVGLASGLSLPVLVSQHLFDTTLEAFINDVTRYKFSPSQIAAVVEVDAALVLDPTVTYLDLVGGGLMMPWIRRWAKRRNLHSPQRLVYRHHTPHRDLAIQVWEAELSSAGLEGRSPVKATAWAAFQAKGGAAKKDTFYHWLLRYEKKQNKQ